MIQKTYLILDTGSNLLKIGKSCNVESRLKALQACCGSKLKLMHYYDVDIENYLHCKFKDFRKHGEWFDIDYKTVIESIDGDSIMSGVVDSKTKNPTTLELDRLRRVS